ncbi:MAG: response regulator transcription factor [Chitinophagales bacterium]|nr:response regulator transcription factor [Chitinophagales bacterium]
MNAKAKISCFVVDDNFIDRKTTLAFLKQYEFIEILGEFESPVDALNAIEEQQPFVLFLDIDMPEMSGLDLRKQLMKIPACIFITSYPEYAVESFDVDALDFMVKPINKARFDKAIQRLVDYYTIKRKADILSHSLDTENIIIKQGSDQIKLQLYEILYLEAMKDYTAIVTNNKKYMVLDVLGNLIKNKAFKNFIRIHRSYAIQKHYVTKYNNNEIELDNNSTLPIGRSYKDTIKELFHQ